jgi:phosphohistidine phosphatase
MVGLFKEPARMLLYIVRHGMAIDREDPRCPSDPERYLTPEGLKRTRQVAASLAKLLDLPKFFLSSPYVRAFQTAEIFAEALDASKSRIERTDLLLPGAEPAAFFRELSHKKSAESVICFGHAPHLDELISFALGAKKDLTGLKKSGVACIELTRVHPSVGKLVWLLTPKAVRKVSKMK